MGEPWKVGNAEYTRVLQEVGRVPCAYYIYIAFNFVDLIKVPLTFTVYSTASVCFLHHSTLLSYVQFKNHIYEQADQS